MALLILRRAFLFLALMQGLVCGIQVPGQKLFTGLPYLQAWEASMSWHWSDWVLIRVLYWGKPSGGTESAEHARIYVDGFPYAGFRMLRSGLFGFGRGDSGFWGVGFVSFIESIEPFKRVAMAGLVVSVLRSSSQEVNQRNRDLGVRKSKKKLGYRLGA